MRTKLNLLLLGSALLFASVMESRALPPRQHALIGQIESIDFTNRIVTLKSEGRSNYAFVWNDTTRFRVTGAAICAEPFTLGRRVRVFYRREAGRLVLREVALVSEASHVPCAGCNAAVQTKDL